jgi:hypothetical protein
MDNNLSFDNSHVFIKNVAARGQKYNNLRIFHGCGMLLRNVGLFSTDYTALYPIR